MFVSQVYKDLIQNATNTRECKYCGCTWNNACPGGCFWVNDELCSSCAKILNDGADAGYMSAMLYVLQLVVVRQNNSPDDFILELDLKKADFLKYWSEEDISFLDEEAMPDHVKKSGY